MVNPSGGTLAKNKPNRDDAIDREEISRELVRKIGSMEPYADADADKVEQRIRNMHYGSTHPRVTKLRRGSEESEE